MNAESPDTPDVTDTSDAPYKSAMQLAAEKIESERASTELTPEQREAFDTLTGAAARALGDDDGAPAIAAQIIAQSAEQFADVADNAVEAAKGLWRDIAEDLERCAEGIETFTIDGTVYRLATIVSLTGSRRSRVVSIIVDAVGTALYLNAHQSAVGIAEILAAFQDSDRWEEFLGAMYLPDGGESWRPDKAMRGKDRDLAWREHFETVGAEINDRLNVDGVVGVIRRFFSSNASGLPGPIRTLLSRFQSLLGSFATGLTPQPESAES